MRELRLEVSKEGQVLETHDLRTDAVTVLGRSADLVLSHKSISRRHANIDPVTSTGHVALTNFAKDGGTRVKGCELKQNERVMLSDGDTMEFGKSSKIYLVFMAGFSKAEDVGADAAPAPDVPQVSSSSSGSKAAGAAPVPMLSSSREDREKEIAAMTASLMAKPAAAMVNVKRETGDDDESSSDDEGFGPQPLTAEQQKARIKKSEQSLKDTLDASAKRLKIPISHSVDLSKHAKIVTCLSSNLSGNRVVSGCQDGTMKIFDFGGMDSRQEAFKEVTPESGVGINDVSHSPSGSQIMVITSNAQPLSFDKEGVQQRKFIRGDMYLTDLVNTKGHTSEVNCAAWHPADNNLVLTGGADGTLRMWDMTSELYLNMLRNKSVMKVRAKQGGNQARVPVNSCSFSPDGHLMVAGCADGSVHIWDEKNIGRTKGVLRCSTSAITFVASLPSAVAGGRDVLVAKSEEGTVYLWDFRAVHSPSCRPFMTCQACPNDSAGSNVAFSPDFSLMCVPAISSEGSVTSSRLCFFHTCGYKDQERPLEACLEIGIGEKCRATRVLWQKNTNQIMVATSSGTIKVLFDPELSKKGVMLSVNKAPPRKKDPMDFVQQVGEIYAPHALPMFKDGHLHEKLSSKGKKIKGASEAMAPKQDAGNSKVTITTSEATKYIINNKGIVENSREVNPRDALLQMHDKVVSSSDSQGPILATTTIEEEEEEIRAMKRQRKE